MNIIWCLNAKKQKKNNKIRDKGSVSVVIVKSKATDGESEENTAGDSVGDREVLQQFFLISLLQHPFHIASTQSGELAIRSSSFHSFHSASRPEGMIFLSLFPCPTFLLC